MAMNAHQLRAAAKRWYALFDFDNPDAQAGYRRGHIGDGPYRLLAVGNFADSLHEHKIALQIFDGFVIPALCPRSHAVVTARRCLAVVPVAVYDMILGPRPRSAGSLSAPSSVGSTHGVFLDLALGRNPSPTPPTEADMSAVFVAAMSPAGQAPGTTGLGLATRLACERLSWRTVATLVSSMGEDIRGSADSVASLLGALTSEPAAVR